MASTAPRLRRDTFEKLREQLATASARCSDDQLLELADGLHDTIRRRRRLSTIEHETPAMRRTRERLALSASWPHWLTNAHH